MVKWLLPLVLLFLTDPERKHGTTNLTTFRLSRRQMIICLFLNSMMQIWQPETRSPRKAFQFYSFPTSKGSSWGSRASISWSCLCGYELVLPCLLLASLIYINNTTRTWNRDLLFSGPGKRPVSSCQTFSFSVPTLAALIFRILFSFTRNFVETFPAKSAPRHLILFPLYECS